MYLFEQVQMVAKAAEEVAEEVAEEEVGLWAQLLAF